MSISYYWLSQMDCLTVPKWNNFILLGTNEQYLNEKSIFNHYSFTNGEVIIRKEAKMKLIM